MGIWIALGVFVGVVAIIVGAYYTLVLRQEEELIGRLTPRREKTRLLVRGKMVKAEDQMSSVGALQGVLEASGNWATRLRELVEQSGLQLNVGTLLLLMACSALLAYLIAVFFTGFATVGISAGTFAAYIPYWYVKRARFKRMLKFEEHFPEAIDLVGRALRAGHALPTGLGMVADELPAPIGTEFRILYDEQNFGLTLPDAMRNFARRIPVLDARFFVTAVLTQRESGGNLAEVLDNLSSVIRERFKIKRQVRVISAHGRITGWVLSCLPPCLGMATLVINPDHLGTLMGSVLGHRMIITAVVLQVVGTLVIRKIVNVEY
jgi:tight adherence protein B